MGLGLLVLVVGEAQVDAAAVDVEGVAEVLARHGRALEVPAGTAVAEGRGPRSGLAARTSLWPFHSAKSRGSRLPRGSASCAASMSSIFWWVSEPYAGKLRTSK